MCFLLFFTDKTSRKRKLEEMLEEMIQGVEALSVGSKVTGCPLPTAEQDTPTPTTKQDIPTAPTAPMTVEELDNQYIADMLADLDCSCVDF